MSSAVVTPQKYVLGLDLGSASLGWAMVGLNDADEPTSLIRAGVRIFEPGVEGSALDIEQGKDQSKAVERRIARLHRRQLRRRAARQRDLFRTLQKHGLLPTNAAGSGASSEQRHALLHDLDQSLSLKFLKPDDDSFAQKPLYMLRKLALDEALEPFELGRVLFHLSQRRGFKSNRKEVKKAAPQTEEQEGKQKDKQKEQDETSVVKAAIRTLEQQMEQAEARTVGEYFAGIDPHEASIRRRWTGRKMFEHEFEMIWAAQAPHHAALLTPELHDEVYRLLFYQRPISAQKHLVGTCELERGDETHPAKKRAPWAAMAAQRFRMLQKINDLMVFSPGNQPPKELTAEQRSELYRLLDREGTQSFVAIRKHLGLEGTTFNLEKGGDKDLPGNRTQKSMLAVFKDKWDSYSEGKQNQIIENWSSSESDEDLMKEAEKHLGLHESAAAMLVKQNPPADYCSLSLTAINKLMPLMLEGRSFKDAETQIYGSRFSGLQVHDTLPPIRQALPTLRNPAVERAMTELRKVVNAIVRAHGKPYEIRIELARELKKPRKEKLKLITKNRKRESENKALAKRMLDECGIPTPPSRRDLEKARLWVESQGECPYTGRCIAFARLFDSAEFDVDHILPISRHPDDSYQNKVLCYAEENRRYKRNRTPFEAYADDPERWNEILARVARWKNPGKARKFTIQSPEELAEFSSRQLNDTRYTSVLALRALALLYGGRDVATSDGNRTVLFASSGAVTANLRREWKFEAILQALVAPEQGETRGKPRTDHRHHAIDAVTVALTRQNVIQSMARANAMLPWQPGMRVGGRVPEPWTTPDFYSELNRQMQEMVVSHRPEHKVSGEIHKGSNFSRPYLYKGKSTIHSRCPVASLKLADIEAEDTIVDPAVRDAVRAKLAELGGNIKSFEVAANAPVLKTANGRSIPIRKVRTRQTKNPLTVGHGVSERFVDSGGIHHVEVFAVRDQARKETWVSSFVQITEAYERRRQKLPVVSHELQGEPDAEFLFSLHKDDTVEMDFNGQRAIFRVKKFYAAGPIWFAGVNNAQMDAAQMKQKTTWSKGANSLKDVKARKVVIDLLGKVHPAND